MSIRKFLLVLIAGLAGIIIFCLLLSAAFEVVLHRTGRAGGYALAAVGFVAIVALVSAQNHKEQRAALQQRAQCGAIGKLIFGTEDFGAFWASATKDSRTPPVVLLANYAERQGACLVTDWTREDEDGAVKAFAAAHLPGPIEWTYTDARYAATPEEGRDDGVFIMQVFRAIDKDLKPAGKQLLFLNTGDDAYHMLVVDRKTFQAIAALKFDGVHGTEKFKV